MWWFMKLLYKLCILLIVISLIYSCTSDNSTNPNIETETPAIIDLTSSKTEILFGGEEFTELECKATGGNLKYTWQVDLGDIIPVTSDKSKVKYKASACCVGIKTIQCTVSNDKGSTEETVIVRIYEEPYNPEILALYSEKEEIKPSESVNLICRAIGGKLKYSWESNCGTIEVNESDNSIAKYTPAPNCNGPQFINCTVSNSRGILFRSLVVNINE